MLVFVFVIIFVKDIVGLYLKVVLILELEKKFICYIIIIIGFVVVLMMLFFYFNVILVIIWLFVWLVFFFFIIVVGLFWKRSVGVVKLVLFFSWFVNLLWFFILFKVYLGLMMFENVYVVVIVVFGFILLGNIGVKNCYLVLFVKKFKFMVVVG